MPGPRREITYKLKHSKGKLRVKYNYSNTGIICYIFLVEQSEKQLTSSIWNCLESQKPQPKWIFYGMQKSSLPTLSRLQLHLALPTANCMEIYSSAVEEALFIFHLYLGYLLAVNQIKISILATIQKHTTFKCFFCNNWWHAILGKLLLRALPRNSVRSGWSHYLKPTSTVIPVSWLFIIKPPSGIKSIDLYNTSVLYRLC